MTELDTTRTSADDFEAPPPAEPRSTPPSLKTIRALLGMMREAKVERFRYHDVQVVFSPDALAPPESVKVDDDEGQSNSGFHPDNPGTYRRM